MLSYRSHALYVGLLEGLLNPDSWWMWGWFVWSQIRFGLLCAQNVFYGIRALLCVVFADASRPHYIRSEPFFFISTVCGLGLFGVCVLSTIALNCALKALWSLFTGVLALCVVLLLRVYSRADCGHFFDSISMSLIFRSVLGVWYAWCPVALEAVSCTCLSWPSEA